MVKEFGAGLFVSFFGLRGLDLEDLSFRVCSKGSGPLWVGGGDHWDYFGV